MEVKTNIFETGGEKLELVGLDKPLEKQDDRRKGKWDHERVFWFLSKLGEKHAYVEGNDLVTKRRITGVVFRERRGGF